MSPNSKLSWCKPTLNKLLGYADFPRNQNYFCESAVLTSECEICGTKINNYTCIPRPVLSLDLYGNSDILIFIRDDFKFIVDKSIRALIVILISRRLDHSS